MKNWILHFAIHTASFECYMQILFNSWFVCVRSPERVHIALINFKCVSRCVCVYVSLSNSLYSLNSEIMFICIVKRSYDSTNAIPLFLLPFQIVFFHLARTFYWNRIEYISLSVSYISFYTIESKPLSCLFAATKIIEKHIFMIVAAAAAFECLHCK